MMCYDGPGILLEGTPLMATVMAADLGIPDADPGENEVEPAPVGGDDLDVRQLRHHTKNTLQRMLALIAEMPGLQETPEGRRIARELENRICMSASIANAMFGLTEAPRPMGTRLRSLAGGLVQMMKGADQVVRCGASVRGQCPAHLRETVLRCTQELVGNAMKHGMKGRPSGRITIRLVSEADRTTLTVIDNGWGFARDAKPGEGLSLVEQFAGLHGGSVSIASDSGTAVRVEWPHQTVG